MLQQQEQQMMIHAGGSGSVDAGSGVASDINDDNAMSNPTSTTSTVATLPLGFSQFNNDEGKNEEEGENVDDDDDEQDEEDDS